MTKHDDPTPEKFDLRSLDLAAEKRAELLRLFPECATEGGKVDFDRLKAALGEQIDAGKERYGLTWPGKAACFQTIQRPSLATLRPKVEESVEFDTTQNVIVEGDNLEVLKLLQKSYLGKVKMIYIDPPYNTGNDFIYPDNYTESLQTYLEYTGQVDGEGRKFSSNTEADGRFHSKWLNMMYPRLYLARNLLREDGVLAVSINDAEVRNLRVVCDELLGEQNFLSLVCVVSNPRGLQSERIATTHEYVLLFARCAETCVIGGEPLAESQIAEFKHAAPDGRKYRVRGLRHRGNASRREDRPGMYFPLYVDPESRTVSVEATDRHTVEVYPRKSSGEDGRWEWGPETAAKRIALLEGHFVEKRGEWDVLQREFLVDGLGAERRTKWKSVWDESSINYQNGKGELDRLFERAPFDFPKPVSLVAKLVEGTTQADDLILDFFAGSGTTAHAVLEQNKKDGGNRKFVLVQLPEPTGRADYPTIADITKERVRRVIKNLNDADKGQLRSANEPKPDRGFRVFQLASSNFKPWDGDQAKDPAGLQRQLFDHVEHVLPDRGEQDLLYEILLKDGFELTTPVATFEVRGFRVHSVANGELLLCLQDKLTHELIQDLAERRPSRVVFLDRGFRGNDQLKTNAAKLFASKAGEGFKKFKTV